MAPRSLAQRYADKRARSRAARRRAASLYAIVRGHVAAMQERRITPAQASDWITNALDRALHRERLAGRAEGRKGVRDADD